MLSSSKIIKDLVPISTLLWRGNITMDGLADNDTYTKVAVQGEEKYTKVAVQGDENERKQARRVRKLDIEKHKD